MRPLLFLPLLLSLACSRQDSGSTKTNPAKGGDTRPVVLENEGFPDIRAAGQREEVNEEASLIQAPNPLRELAAKNVTVVRDQASRGNAEAQVDLGLMYFHGINVPRNNVIAKRWWQHAARQDNPAAIQNLGILVPPPQREAVSFFGTPGQGSRFVFIIDKSGSMDGDRLAHAKRELVGTLRQLPGHAQFMVYFFDDGPDPMLQRGMMTATPANVRQASGWIMGRACQGGGTEPAGAIRLAFALTPDTVWLLSDGVFDNTNTRLVETLNRGDKARVNTLAFHDRTGEALLQTIARENSGSYRFVAAAR